MRKALFAFLACLPLFPQGSTGRIDGTITDESGGVLVGAKVTVTDVQRGIPRVLVTDSAGAFAAPNLIPGVYSVRAEFRGFSVVERQDMVVEVAQDVRVDLSLQPGEQTQTITVSGTGAVVNTSNAELGGTIANNIINDAPLNGRNFQNLLDLRPGVSKYPGNSAWTTSANGLRPHDNYYMVEGINSNEPWRGQSVMNGPQPAGDAATILPIDAIDEIRLQQNPRAEYGWEPGVVVNLGIKSGSNEIHGTAYAYGRDGDWDAKDFFVSQPVAVSLQQFGSSAGGPIKKDKLFYFANFEEQRFRVANPIQHKVPITAAGVGPAGQNLIGACNAARSNGMLTALSAQLAGLSVSCTPLSNYPGLFPVNSGADPLDPRNWNTSLSNDNKIDSVIAKLDYRLNAKHSLSGMYFISPGDGILVDNPTLEVARQWLDHEHTRAQLGSGNWTWVPSPRWVNSLRVGYSHSYSFAQSVDAAQNPANYSYNGNAYQIYTGQTNPRYFGLPRIVLQGGFSLQMGLNPIGTKGPTGVYQFSDSLSHQHGRHALKFGGEVLVRQVTDNTTSAINGVMRFPNLQSFFDGIMNGASFTAGDLLRHFQNEAYGFFVQDDWRVRPRLTVNEGLRYELNTVFKEADSLMGNFDPSVGLVQVGKQIQAPFQGDHYNFAPRLGFAWDVFGTGRTVIRAGGGVYYEQGTYDSFMGLNNRLGLRTEPTGVNLYTEGNPNPTTAGGTINVGLIGFTRAILQSQTAPGSVRYNWANNGPNTPIFSAIPACGDGTVRLPSGITAQPCNVLSVARNLRSPYVKTWTLGLQHAITTSLTIDVSYVGNHGTKLLGLIDMNQPTLVGGFSPGWGNPAVSGTPAALCLASAPAYENCNPDAAAEQRARPFNGRFPYLQDIILLSNSNFSNYNALQASLTKRLSHGLSFVVAYGFAHSLGMSGDNGLGLATPMDSHHLRDLYQTFADGSDFSTTVNYTIPGIKSPGQILQGWSFNTILSVKSRLPWGVLDGTTDFSGTAEGSEQWDFFGKASDFKTTKALINTNGGAGGIPYFPGTSNAACLARSQGMGPLAIASLTNLGCYALGSSLMVPPAYGSYGTLGQGVFRGMPYFNMDLSVTKNWQFRERLTAQFRGEFFNVLNHPNISNVIGGPGGDNTFADPSANNPFGFRNETPDVTSSNTVLGSGGPRVIQLGVKFIF